MRTEAVEVGSPARCPKAAPERSRMPLGRGLAWSDKAFKQPLHRAVRRDWRGGNRSGEADRALGWERERMVAWT